MRFSAGPLKRNWRAGLFVLIALAAPFNSLATGFCELPSKRVFDNGLRHRCIVQAKDSSLSGRQFADLSECPVNGNSSTQLHKHAWQLAFESGGESECRAFRPVNDANGNIFVNFVGSTGDDLKLHMVLDYTRVPHPCTGKHFDWLALQARSPALPDLQNLVTRVNVEPRISAGVREAKFFVAVKGDKISLDGRRTRFVLGVHFFRLSQAAPRFPTLPSVVTARECHPSEPCNEAVHLNGKALNYWVPANTQGELEIDWGTVLEYVKGLRVEGHPVFQPYRNVRVTAIRVGMEPRGADHERQELFIKDFTVLSRSPADCR